MFIGFINVLNSFASLVELTLTLFISHSIGLQSTLLFLYSLRCMALALREKPFVTSFSLRRLFSRTGSRPGRLPCQQRRHSPKPSLKIGSVNKAFVFWYWLRPKRIFNRNNFFLFFKIESWNFQHLFEKAFGETSQNFNSIRKSIEKLKKTIVWMSWMS